MLGAFKTGFIWLSGLIMTALLPVLIFKYGAGLADLSRIEWAFMVLMALLIWRHVRYCRHFGLGFLRGFSRLLIYQGLLMTVEVVLIGLVASVLVGTQSVDTATDHLREFMQVLMMDDPVSTILGFGLILFATYLAAPSSHRRAPHGACNRAEISTGYTFGHSNQGAGPMKSAPVCIALLLALALPRVSAAANDSTKLVQGCKELIAIYSSREQQRLMAAATTSLSEAMMAGYCRGVVSEYQRRSYCGVTDWHELASRVAELSDWETATDNVDSVLGKACGQ